MKVEQVYSLAQLERFDAAAYLAGLALPAVTTLADLAGRDAAAVSELAAIDAMIARSMKLRLEPIDALAPPTRNVFAATIAQYADRLDLLEQRVHGVTPAAVPAVMAAARELLELRATLHAGVLELVRAAAAADVALADAHARDRKLDEAVRKQWSRARRDLEALALDPRGIATPTAQRHAAYPEQLDEPPAGPEPTFADMIELD